MEQEKRLYTIREVAEMLRVNPETLRRWDREGKVKAFRIGVRGHRKYTKEQIDQLLKTT